MKVLVNIKVDSSRIMENWVSTRPIARGDMGEGGATTTPNLPKGLLFATKWTKNGVL